MERHTRRRRAFTMVELLVVLGILVALAALLLPALGQVRENGRRVQCLSNLRTLTAAWLTYAGDNGGRFCSSSSDTRFDQFGRPRFFWSWIDFSLGHEPPAAVLAKYGSKAEYARKEGLLWPCLNNEDVYFCPSYAIVRTKSPTSYGINALFAGGGTSLLKLDEVQRPATTFAFIEGDTPVNRPLVATPFAAPIYPSNVFVPGSRPGMNHFDKYNIAVGAGVSFADGHAIFWRYTDPRTGDRWSAAAPNAPDVYQLEAWSGGPIPPGVNP